MKSPKVGLVALTFALAFTAGCSDDKDPKDGSDPTASTSTSPSASSTPKETEAPKKVAPEAKKSDVMKQGSARSTNDGERPSADDIAASLATENVLVPFTVTDKQAQCIGTIIFDSKMTDGGIRAIVGKDFEFYKKASKADTAAATEAVAKFQKKCLD